MTQHADIDTFEQHGARFWDENGPYRTLHEINPARVALIERYIAIRGQKMLDIGCGGGILSEALAERGAEVTGIDLSAAVLAAAQAHAEGHGLHIDYQHGDSSTLARSHAGYYDHITCMEMLEHVSDPLPVLRDIYTLLKSGGYVFLSTLNRTLPSWLGAIVAAEYVLRIVPQNTHHHAWFITPAELMRMLENSGLIPQALVGMDYDPIRKRATLSHNTSINYFLVAQKPYSA